MFEVLLGNINKKISLTEKEQELVKTFFIPKKLRRKQFLLQEGEVCQYTAFVEKGLLRSYNVDEKGHEHVLQFAVEDWWIADLYSFLTGEPSGYNIDALEDTELLLINGSSYEAMMEAVPKMERYFRILTQNSLVATQRRLSGNISLTAEENYKQLIAGNNTILQRVPQHMIASFLGIAPETLSRVRRQMTGK
ncbi:Crp/Fnr family transcriptional regulator [Terrimonas ferruginea]|uniref:Crp/Fnr family transcriptional regulator n=1 Tax=Terrimonas ferruginea TaxID=249 RepID=UPI000405371A|nr:Crp/Fnr family transcriptional regulator [Terrimonas ferruginea]